MQKELADAIEELVDKYGMVRFVDALNYVCEQKAEHVAVNWQDAAQAKKWAALGIELDRIVAIAEYYGLE